MKAAILIALAITIPSVATAAEPGQTAKAQRALSKPAERKAGGCTACACCDTYKIALPGRTVVEFLMQSRREERV